MIGNYSVFACFCCTAPQKYIAPSHFLPGGSVCAFLAPAPSRDLGGLRGFPTVPGGELECWQLVKHRLDTMWLWDRCCTKHQLGSHRTYGSDLESRFELVENQNGWHFDTFTIIYLLRLLHDLFLWDREFRARCVWRLPWAWLASRPFSVDVRGNHRAPFRWVKQMRRMCPIFGMSNNLAATWPFRFPKGEGKV